MIPSAVFNVPFWVSTNFFNRRLTDQNINKIVSELEIAERALIQSATDSGAAKKENNRPNTMNKGAPGG